MRPTKSDRKHPQVARDAMDDIKDGSDDSRPVHSEIRYVNANRDRALGEADRTGRHYDEETTTPPDEGSAASEDHEAD